MYLKQWKYEGYSWHQHIWYICVIRGQTFHWKIWRAIAWIGQKRTPLQESTQQSWPESCKVVAIKRYRIFKIALGLSQSGNTTSRIHPMKLILVESLLLSLLLCLSCSLMPGIFGYVWCILHLFLGMFVICLSRIMKSGSDETIDVDEYQYCSWLAIQRTIP